MFAIPFRKALSVTALGAVLVAGFPVSTASAAGALDATVSGVVWRDHGQDGTKNDFDPGWGGVTVSAFDDDGDLVATDVSDLVDGTYSLAINDANDNGALRIEFTIPTSQEFLENGPLGPDNGSSVQFVTVANGGTATDIDYSVINPADFSQDDPQIRTTAFRGGTRIGQTDETPNPGALNQTNAALIEFGYTYDGSSQDDTAPDPFILANIQEVGAIQGLAYSPLNQNTYAAAYIKRHTDMGPGGENAIYVVNADGTSVTQLAHDVDTYAGTFPTSAERGIATDEFNVDEQVFGLVGKAGWGDIDISEDYESLWGINLGSRTLVNIPLSDPANETTYSAPSQSCTDGVLRPFGIGVHDGLVYTGWTCTGELLAPGNGGPDTELTAHVFALDPATDTWSASLLDIPLNFDRESVYTGDTPNNGWEPWVDSWFVEGNNVTNAEIATSTPLILSAGGVERRPMAMLADIAFDWDGSMVLGFRDRLGDMVGPGNRRPLPNELDPIVELNTPTTGGDLMRAAPPLNGVGQYRVENDASSAIGYGADTELGSDLGLGLGGQEFYYDNYREAYHAETADGAALLLPALQTAAGTETLINELGPRSSDSSGGTTHYNNLTGFGCCTDTGSPEEINRSYELYAGGGRLFAKANGLGDLIAITELAPVEIGNRVWVDTDRDGIQDPSEAPIAGVTVTLTIGAVTYTTVTDADGVYLFSSDDRRTDTSSANYAIADLVPGAEVTLSVPLTAVVSGLTLDLTSKDQTTGGDDLDDTRDSDANLATGITDTITIGGPGQNDHTFDFGYAGAPELNLGNQVWFDTNNNGAIDVGELPIAGVVVELFIDRDGDGILTGVEQTPVGTDTTDVDGLYLFGDLFEQTDYIVGIAPSNFAPGGPLVGYYSSLTSADDDGTLVETAPADPDTDVDSDDNGAMVTDPADFYAGGVLALAVNLADADEPTDEDPDNNVPGTPDENSNLTVDFGFYTVSVGDLVWLDNGAGDGGVTDDGLRNGTEPALANIPVRLYAADGTTQIPVGADGILGTADDSLDPVLTDGNGNYEFSGLPAGTYVVTIEVPDGYQSSTDPAGGPTPLGANDDDNGTGTGTGVVTSETFTLVPGATTDGHVPDNTDGSTHNPRVDFGVVPLIDLTIEKVVTSSGPYAAGTDVTYDLTVTNNGPGEAMDGFTVTDRLPAGLVYRSPATTVGSEWICGPAAGQLVTCTWQGPTPGIGNDTLPVGVPTPAVQINAELTAPAPLTGLVNDAKVVPNPDDVVETIPVGDDDDGFENGDPDPDDDNPSNNDDSKVITPAIVVAVGDYTWIDVNRDGLQGVDEPVLEGVEVRIGNAFGEDILDASGNPVGPEFTDENGLYLFDNLLPGNYVVQFILPSGYSFTQQLVTGPSAPNDSNASLIDGKTPLFSVTDSVGGETVVDTDPATAASFVNPTIDAGVVAMDLDIDKVLLPGGPYFAGETVTYTLQVSNNGPAEAFDGLSITDRLPDGLTFVSAVPATASEWTCGAASPSAGDTSEFSCTWNGPTIGADQLGVDATTGLITVTATVDADAPLASLVNYAKVLPNPRDIAETIPVGTTNDGYETGDPTIGSNNDDSAPISVVRPPAMDLTIDKTLTSAGPYAAGATVTFGLTVTNLGPDAAQDGLTVVDRLPVGLTFAAPATTAGTSWDCAASSGQTVTCTWLGLTPGLGNDTLGVGISTLPITINAVVSAGVAPGSVLVNDAKVVPAPGDIVETILLGTDDDGYETGDPAVDSNNDDSAQITTPPATPPKAYDLTIAKTVTSSGPYKAGSIVTYTLVPTNLGPDSALDGLTVTDRLPVGLTYVGNGATAGAEYTCAAPVGQDVTCTWNGPTAGLNNDVLTAGASAPAVTITATVNAPALAVPLTNLAKVEPSPDEPNPETVPPGDNDGFENGDPDPDDDDPSNNDDSKVIIPTPKHFDLTIEKLLTSAGPYTAGATVTYTIEATNLGPDAALDGLSVVDRLPAGLTYAGTAADGGSEWVCGPAAGQLVTCTWNGATAGEETLAAGASAPLITINATVDAPASGATLINDAKVLPSPRETVPEDIPVGTDDDGYETGDPTTGSNNDDSVPLTTVPAPLEFDLTIAKTLTSAGPFVAGSPVTYQLVVTNNGPGAAQEDLTVTDRLPAGLTFSGAGATGANWTCAAPVGQDITCNWDGPTAGDGDQLVATAATTPIVVTATIDADVAPGTYTNFSKVVPAPDDPLDETIPPGDNDGFENGDPTPDDDNPSNNDDSTPLIIPPVTPQTIDLKIEKLLTSAGPFMAGTPVTYTLQATNNGPGAAQDGITVTDRLPDGLSFAAPVAASGTDWTCAAPVGQEVTCTWNGPTAGRDLLGAGGSAPLVTVNAVVNTPAPTTEQVNFAVVRPAVDEPLVETIPVGGNGGYEDGNPNTGSNNDDSKPLIPTPPVEPQPFDLTIRKIVTSTAPYVAGSPVTYELRVTNLGPGVAQDGLVVTDRLPAGLTFSSIAGGSSWICDGSAVVNPDGTSDVSCYWDGTVAGIGNEALVAGATTLPITVTATVNTPAPVEALVNFAKVVPNPNDPADETIPPGDNDGFENGDPDPDGDDPSNNDDSKPIIPSTPVVQPFDLTIAKIVTSSGPYKTGSTVTYQLQVTNLGPGVAQDGLTVTDRLPVGLTFVSATPGAGWTCGPLVGTDVTCTWNGPTDGVGNDVLAAGQFTTPITITTTVDASATGSLINLAKVEPNPDDPADETIPPGDNDGFENGDPDPDDDDPSNNDDSKIIDKQPVVAVGDYTWIDTNSNGVQDPGEPVLPGVTVTLFNADGTPAVDADGNPVAPAVTDATGKYLFDNLDPGNYYIEFTLPPGYNFTKTGGGISTNDSNPNVTTGRTPVFTISASVVGDTVADTDPATLATFVNPTIDAGVIVEVSPDDEEPPGTPPGNPPTNSPPTNNPPNVRPNTTTRGPLAYTGAETMVLVYGGLFTMLLGFALVLGTTRRRKVVAVKTSSGPYLG